MTAPPPVRAVSPAKPQPWGPPDCILCNASVSGNWDVGFQITGSRATGQAAFYFNGSRWVPDPKYVTPWWSDYLDYGFGCLAVCPLAVGGVAVGVAEGGAAVSAALGPAGPIFGDTAFGADSQGILNQGRLGVGLRGGFGRGRGLANFRVGIWNFKWDIFTRPIPPR